MFWDNLINIVEYCFILLFFDVRPKCWKKELFLSKNASVHPLDRYWTFYFGEKVWFFRLLSAWLKVSIFDVLRQFNQHCWILLYSSFLWRPAKMLEKRTFLTKKCFTCLTNIGHFTFGEKVCFLRLLSAWLKVSIFDVLRQCNQHCWILLHSSFLRRPAEMLEKRTFLTKKCFTRLTDIGHFTFGEKVWFSGFFQLD